MVLTFADGVGATAIRGFETATAVGFAPKSISLETGSLDSGPEAKMEDCLRECDVDALTFASNESSDCFRDD